MRRLEKIEEREKTGEERAKKRNGRRGKIKNSKIQNSKYLFIHQQSTRFIMI
jgi:hypothetical protein